MTINGLKSSLRVLWSVGKHFAPLEPFSNHPGLRRPGRPIVGIMPDQVCREHFDLWEFVTDPRRLIQGARSFL